MRCIYCPADATGAERNAHVIPQGLGSTDMVLPAGVECDSCNEYAGSLELALLHHNHIWPILMLLGVPGKRDRPRERLGFMERTVEGNLVMRAPASRTKTSITPGKVEIEGGDPSEFDNAKFRRALHHIAFNYVVRERGHEHGLRAEYDEVRRYVRNARPGERWPYAQVIVQSEHTRSTLVQSKRLNLAIMPDAPGLVVRFECYVDDFYVDLLNSGELHEWAARALPAGVGLL